MKCFLKHGAATTTLALPLRQTCQNWRDVVDEHFDNAPNTREELPVVKIKLPLDDSGFQLVQQLGEHKRNPFIGGRVCLMFRDPSKAIGIYDVYQLLQYPTNTVWQHVRHLSLSVIEDDSDEDDDVGVAPDWFNRAFQGYFQPWLSQMTKVVSMECLMPFGYESAIRGLPNPHLVEDIYVCNYDIYYGVDWQTLFSRDCNRLKRFSCDRVDEYLKRAFESVRFDRLEELRIHSDEPQKLFDFMTPDQFPELKVFGIRLPFWTGFDDTPEEWDKGQFSQELVGFTNKFRTVEAIELYSSRVPHLLFDGLPISICLFGRGSRAVTKLSMFGATSTVRHRPRQPMCWLKALAACFPCIKFVQARNRSFRV